MAKANAARQVSYEKLVEKRLSMMAQLEELEAEIIKRSGEKCDEFTAEIKKYFDNNAYNFKDKILEADKKSLKLLAKHIVRDFDEVLKEAELDKDTSDKKDDDSDDSSDREKELVNKKQVPDDSSINVVKKLENVTPPAPNPATVQVASTTATPVQNNATSAQKIAQQFAQQAPRSGIQFPGTNS